VRQGCHPRQKPLRESFPKSSFCYNAFFASCRARRKPAVLILPAIDLRGGRCVRLQQGDYAKETVFGDDPAAVAQRWVSAGATFLHIVDLDGAREGRPVNGTSIQQIVRAAGIPCQLGGGLRTEADIEQALGWGVARVVLGTRALQDPAWFERVCRKLPGKIVAGIDAKEGKVATQGWLEVGARTALDLATQVAAWPIAAIVYTDISRDGMLGGPNLDAMAGMAAAVKVPVIASGGVTSIEDIRRLAERGLAGAIVGRALYEGRLDLAAAIQEGATRQESGVRKEITDPAPGS
jgi:phosphoribosylformimino-5-aminoimidazole carboxamide ribotide isomerase